MIQTMKINTNRIILLWALIFASNLALSLSVRIRNSRIGRLPRARQQRHQEQTYEHDGPDLLNRTVNRSSDNEPKGPSTVLARPIERPSIAPISVPLPPDQLSKSDIIKQGRPIPDLNVEYVPSPSSSDKENSPSNSECGNGENGNGDPSAGAITLPGLKGNVLADQGEKEKASLENDSTSEGYNSVQKSKFKHYFKTKNGFYWCKICDKSVCRTSNKGPHYGRHLRSKHPEILEKIIPYLT